MSSRKTSKRQRTTNPFVSLEAEEKGASSEEEEDNIDDDFLEFEPMVADRDTCHAHLYREYTRTQEDDWKAFLERAERRGSVTKDRDLASANTSGEGCADKYMSEGVEPTSADTFYRVPVKPGWEIAYTFQIMERLFSVNSSAPSAIRSVVGRASYPGAIFVEATTVEAVYHACRLFTHARLGAIHKVPSEEAKLCLRERQSFAPHSPGWVRLASGRYKGDTAYVNNVTRSLCVELIIIPRISSDSNKRKCRGRAPQALFDATTLPSSFNVEKRNQGHLFRGDMYLDGFMLKETEDFDHSDALPTWEELDLFQTCPYIPPEFIQRTRDTLIDTGFRAGDHVLIVAGPLQGHPGIVENVEEHAANVRILGLDLSTAVDRRELRKHFRVGDEVKVTAGSNAGCTGWVVAILPTTLVVFNHKLEIELTVPANYVEFWSSDAILDPKKKIAEGDLVSVVTRPNDKIVWRVVQIKHEKALLADVANRSEMITEPIDSLVPYQQPEPSLNDWKPDPNRKYISRQVVVSGCRAQKQYRGIIRDVYNDGCASVELEAKLARTRIKLTDLAMLVGGKLTRLKDLRDGKSTELKDIEDYQPRSAGFTGYIPAPSTPLPRDFTAASSPVWNPSSCTPIPPSSHPITPSMPLPASWTQPIVPGPSSNPHTMPWFLMPGLPVERLKARISGSRPLLRDPGWKQGQYEGRFGILTSADDQGAKLRLNLTETLHVPSRYLLPQPPDCAREIVVVISGPMTSQEFIVTKVERTGCWLKPRTAKGRHAEPILMDNASLCTVKP